jgi:hypothetical protein
MELGVGFVTSWGREWNDVSEVVQMRIAALHAEPLHGQCEGRTLQRIVRSLREHVLETHMDAPVPEFP